jgi:tetratricopeptide (TPR) repeat protein
MYQAGLGMVEESTRNFEEVIRRGGTFPATFGFLADDYLQLDRPDRALETVQLYASRNPENASGRRNVGSALLGLGRHREAAEALALAARLNPAGTTAHFRQAIALMLAEDWTAARDLASGLAAGARDADRWLGAMAMAVHSLYAGNATEARRWAERASAAYERPVGRTITSRLLQSRVELAAMRPAPALAAAQRAFDEAQFLSGVGPAVLGFAHLLARNGRAADGEAHLTAFAATSSPPTARYVARAVAHGRGLLALVARDHPTAVRELTAALAGFPPRPSNEMERPSELVALWFALGEAHLGAGNAAEARTWFEKIATGPYERAMWPIEYVRSLYQLAAIAEAEGDAAKAVEYYRRFLGYWGDGEIDRDKVEIARRKLRATS